MIQFDLRFFRFFRHQLEKARSFANFLNRRSLLLRVCSFEQTFVGDSFFENSQAEKNHHLDMVTNSPGKPTVDVEEFPAFLLHLVEIYP